MFILVMERYMYIYLSITSINISITYTLTHPHTTTIYTCTPPSPNLPQTYSNIAHCPYLPTQRPIHAHSCNAYLYKYTLLLQVSRHSRTCVPLPHSHSDMSTLLYTLSAVHRCIHTYLQYNRPTHALTPTCTRAPPRHIHTC